MLSNMFSLVLATLFVTPVLTFAPAPFRVQQQRVTATSLAFFDKMFEEEGPLGKGITVGKVSVALTTTDRSNRSIFGALKDAVEESGSAATNYDLAVLAQTVCLALLRRKDSWTAASSDSKWFKEDDSGKAESLYNDWANREAVKFEKEYTAIVGDKEQGGATVVVVSLVLEMVGDHTKFDGAGFSLAQTVAVLQSIAGDVMVEDGDCLNAVEVFWTPGEPTESLSSMDLIADFPELVTL